MLGYEEKDLTQMSDAVADAMASGRLSREIEEGLEMTFTFLQGLWSEGYFD